MQLLKSVNYGGISTIRSLRLLIEGDVNRHLLPHLAKLVSTTLTTLYFDATKLEGLAAIQPLDVFFTHCKGIRKLSITRLDFFEITFTDTFKSGVFRLESLEIVGCGDPASLFNECPIQNLLVLAFSGYTTGAGLLILAYIFPNLRSFAIEVEYFANVLPSFFFALATNCPNLVRITMKISRIDVYCLEALTSLHLKELYLGYFDHYPGFTKCMQSSFKKLKKLGVYVGGIGQDGVGFINEVGSRLTDLVVDDPDDETLDLIPKMCMNLQRLRLKGMKGAAGGYLSKFETEKDYTKSLVKIERFVVDYVETSVDE